MIQYISSSPEAVVTLLLFVLAFLGSTIALAYTVLVNYPTIVRFITSKSLVAVDPALNAKVKVIFEHQGQTREIYELHQIELEIFNSHPRQQINDKNITIHLKSANLTVLSVTAASSNNQTPNLGGRKITTKIELVPSTPPDLLLETVPQSFYPALVVFIPYLNRVTQHDRIFLKITFTGSLQDIYVQGALFKIANHYYIQQRLTLYSVIVLLMLCAISAMLLISGQAPDVISLATNPIFRGGRQLLIFLSFIMLSSFILEKWWQNWMRTLPNPFIPPPYESESLKRLYYHDTMT